MQRKPGAGLFLAVATTMRPPIAVFLFAIFLGCAASSSYKIIDVIDLPPPRQVQAERHGDQVIIRWQTGPERRLVRFSGYKLFMAKHSLATTPVQELPAPIDLADTDTTFAFVSTDTVKLFLHLRSSLGGQNLSLPSLPEVIVPGKSIH